MIPLSSRILRQNSCRSLFNVGVCRFGVVTGKPVEVVPTNFESVYTMAPFEPELDITSHHALKNRIFGCAVKYVSPDDLKFQLPKEGKAEIAFIGRSNVGKSSLIDALLGHHSLVRISKQPGCTKSLNFFTFIKGTHKLTDKTANVDSRVPHDTSKHIAYLVDMPGYGFAKVGRSEKDRWSEVLESYLLVRNQAVLRRVFVLVDARHGLKDLDTDMMYLLNQSNIAYQLVMTKVDLVKPKELQERLHHAFQVMLAMRGNTCFPFIHTVSSVNNYGIETLKLNMTEILAQRWDVPLEQALVE